MDAYGIDYKKSMKAFEDMTDTRVYNWEVGYERYDFSYEFKYNEMESIAKQLGWN